MSSAQILDSPPLPNTVTFHFPSQQNALAIELLSPATEATSTTSAASTSTPPSVEKVATVSSPPVTKDNGTDSPAAAPKLPIYQTISNRDRNIVLGSALLGLFLAALDQLIVSVALPTIISDLGGLDLLAWVVASYLLTSSATMPLYGKFSDVFGRRPIMLTAIAIFLVGSALCGAATSIWFLIGARGVQGIGGGGLLSLISIIIGDVVEPRQRPTWLSSVAMMFGIASVVGPVVGGFFTELVTWRWIFFVNLPLGAVAFVLCFFSMKHIHNAQKDLPLDILGSILIASSTCCLVLFVTWGGNAQGYPWSSWQIIFLIVMWVVLGVAFFFQEARHPEPILNLRLFANHNVLLSIVIMVFVGINFYGVLAFLGLYFQDVIGDGPVISGLKAFPQVAGIFTFSLMSGKYISRTGDFRWFPVTGGACLALGCGLLYLLREDTNYGVTFVFLVIVGIGFGQLLPTMASIVQNSVEPKDMASGMSAINFARNLGGCAGVAIFGAIFSDRITYYVDHNFSPSLLSTPTLQLQQSPSLMPGAFDLLPRSLPALNNGVALDANHPFDFGTSHLADNLVHSRSHSSAGSHGFGVFGNNGTGLTGPVFTGCSTLSHGVELCLLAFQYALPIVYITGVGPAAIAMVLGLFIRRNTLFAKQPPGAAAAAAAKPTTATTTAAPAAAASTTATTETAAQPEAAKENGAATNGDNTEHVISFEV